MEFEGEGQEEEEESVASCQLPEKNNWLLATEISPHPKTIP